MAKFHDIDVEATLKATERDTIFLTVAADSSKKIRFFPPVNNDGNLFTLNVNHFGLEEDDRGVAYGCLNKHGDGDCPLCKVAWYMIDSEDKGLIKVGKSIKPSNNWYAQVLDGRQVDLKDENDEVVLDKKGNRTKCTQWFGPYLMRFSKTGAEAINAILRSQKEMGEPFLTDSKIGKAVAFTRTGTGYDTKYTAMITGDPADLDAIFPEWKEKAFEDIFEKLDVKIKSPEQMIAAACAAHSIDWAIVLKDAGVA